MVKKRDIIELYEEHGLGGSSDMLVTQLDKVNKELKSWENMYGLTTTEVILSKKCPYNVPEDVFDKWTTKYWEKLAYEGDNTLLDEEILVRGTTQRVMQGDVLFRMRDIGDKSINVILTSPPYNTQRDLKDRGYDIYKDDKTEEDYSSWIVSVIESYDRVLSDNGVILLNMSYGNESPLAMIEVISKLTNDTEFMVADIITWKKKNAMPNNMSHNKLTRIVEYIFVICRKNEYKTYQSNREVSSVRSTGQKTYKVEYNYVEAKNNDGPTKLNKATFSSELVLKLLDMYARDGDTVLDSFMGTGTTLIGATLRGINGIGIELSEEQCKYSLDRLSKLGEEE